MDTGTANACNGSREEYLMCKLCLFRKKFRSLHEDAAQCYVKLQKEEFYKKSYWIITLQNQILKQDPIVEEVLSKEYQDKNSYEGKYCILKKIYGPWYLENLDEQKHHVLFNLLDENNNYERLIYLLQYIARIYLFLTDVEMFPMLRYCVSLEF